MGRRATDLTTPVPVLGVPALVGVNGWRTTAGDRTLLQTCGPQCSVGVQTSPGISRPPTRYSAQLSELTLSTSSDNVAQTPNSDITEETDYKEILQLTGSDKEKGAILKQISGESRTKKEVTFKAHGCGSSQDVTCCQRNSSGNYCHARAIKTNPHFAGNVSGVGPKLKSATRCTNGSVVDSEAMGGISVDGDDAEPVQSATSHRRHQTRRQGQHSEACGKMLLLSAARTFSRPRKLCSHCGGRQSVNTRVVTLGEKNSAADGCLREKSLTSKILTPSHLEISETNRDKQTHFTVSPQMIHHSEEVKYRKAAHTACPVHTRSNFVTVSQKHDAGNTTSSRPSSVLHAKTTTVTKATIETRQDDSSTKYLVNPSPDGKIARPTSLMLTPQMATATRSNNPHSHTYPKHHRTPPYNSTQHGVPQNVCVSANGTPPSHLYPAAALPGNTPISKTHEATMTFDAPRMSTESMLAKVANAQLETLPMHAARANTASTTNGPKTKDACPTASLVNALDPSPKPETTSHRTPVSPQCASHDPGHKAREQQRTNIDKNKSGKANCIDTMMNSTGSAHPPQSAATTQSTSSHSSYHSTPTSTTHSSAAAQIHPVHAQFSNSDPVRGSAASLNAARPLGLGATLLLRAAPMSPCSSTLYKSVALRSSSVILKSSPPTTSSKLTKNQRNLCLSGTASLQSAAATHQGKVHNEAAHTNQPCHTHKNSRTQTSDGSSLCVIFNQENNSATTPSAASELNVSKHHNGDTDARHLKSAIILNNQSCTDKSFDGNRISKLVYESRQHENSNVSQVTSHKNYISLIETSSSCLQGINTEQQRFAHHQGYIETEHEGHCVMCQPVKTGQERDLNTNKIAKGLSVRCGNIKRTSSADKQTYRNNQTPYVITQRNSEPIVSSRETSSPHVDPITESSDTSSIPQAHTGAEISATAMATLHSKDEHSKHTGPEWEPTLPPSTKQIASHTSFQSCKAEDIVRLDSKFGPAHPEDSSLTHSHPAGVALLLPPSPQCCASATLQQKLDTVEASLAANKDRITTLLHIIHDLEMCHTPTSCRRCYKTGQDLKNCATCQKTACIVYSLYLASYGPIEIKDQLFSGDLLAESSSNAKLRIKSHKSSVEYDFRQQERRFMGVLNHSASVNKAFSMHQPLNFSLLRKIIIKNLKKSKTKSSKLCKTLFKLLPSKMQQVQTS